MTSHVAIRSENPFATRFTRPGAMPFLFPGHESAESIVAQFTTVGRCGAIVGPHGSGKSTLLAALVSALADAGQNPIVHTLHDGQRRLPPHFLAPTQPCDVLVIDGYEQLSWWGRRPVWKAVRRAGAGLLVTAHAPVAGLPTIYATRPTLPSAQQVVARLMPSAPTADVSDDDVRRFFEQSHGNVREMLFKLYDLYESQRS